MEFVGRVVVRTGYCRNRKVRFSLLPDFLIRNRRVSRLGLAGIQAYYRSQSNNLKKAIDEWTEGLGEEFYVPLSTAHEWLSLKIPVPP